MKKSGSKESGSNCEKTRSTGGQGRRKGTQRQTKRTKRQHQKTPEKDKDQLKTKPKGSARKRTKSTSTTVSTDTNKNSDNTSKISSPDKEDKDESSVSQNRKPSEQTKEDTTNLATCQEPKPRSRPKSSRVPVEESTKRKDEGKEKEPQISDKGEKKFNMHLAQLFFKRMMEAQKTKKTPNKNRDENLEVMPDVSFMANVPIRNVKKSKNRHRKPSKPLDSTIFQANGQPVWMVPDRKHEVQMDDGVWTKIPELMKALEEENLKLDDPKKWLSMIEDFFAGKFDDGIIKADLLSDSKVDPFAPFKQLDERSDVFFRYDSMVYYTLSNMLTLSKEAVDRFFNQEKGLIEQPRRLDAQSISGKPSKKEAEEKEKTCVVTSISINMDSTFSISYDRRRPIISIKKFRQRGNQSIRFSHYIECIRAVQNIEIKTIEIKVLGWRESLCHSVCLITVLVYGGCV
ncbi:hypothetical protein B9Z55_003077 [Caenorhabditis nigoni]|uniref:Uncharacterized protein n=1 Tax=Caenorhabditis nigoni TaxID=1611254 RepID=A0A2G5VNI1_9PELO|nr:hypothetical protein B9Z55_003077 [Caenorhabditis nigoni]